MNKGDRISSEECVSEDNGCACCRTSLNAELLERADKLSVEVSVLSLREGSSRRLYRCGGRNSELVVPCDGVYSEVLFKRFDSDVEGFLRGLSGGYILEEVVLISDGSFSGCKCVYSVSGIGTRLT